MSNPVRQLFKSASSTKSTKSVQHSVDLIVDLMENVQLNAEELFLGDIRCGGLLNFDEEAAVKIVRIILRAFPGQELLLPLAHFKSISLEFSENMATFVLLFNNTFVGDNFLLAEMSKQGLHNMIIVVVEKATVVKHEIDLKTRFNVQNMTSAERNHMMAVINMPEKARLSALKKVLRGCPHLKYAYKASHPIILHNDFRFRKTDVDRLLDKQWLSDFMIEAIVGSMIIEAGLCSRVFLFPSTFVGDPSLFDRSRWALPEDIWTKDLLIMPYNCYTNHWSVVFVLNPKALKDGQGTCKLFHCDSGGPHPALKKAEDVMSRLAKSTFSNSEGIWIQGSTVAARPRFTTDVCYHIKQKNGYDCGVFLIKFVQGMLEQLQTMAPRETDCTIRKFSGDDVTLLRREKREQYKNISIEYLTNEGYAVNMEEWSKKDPLEFEMCLSDFHNEVDVTEESLCPMEVDGNEAAKSVQSISSRFTNCQAQMFNALVGGDITFENYQLHMFQAWEEMYEDLKKKETYII